MSEPHPISLLESIILGFVQGATEFLPVSSSGHLVIIQNLFGVQGSIVLFDVMVHVGTLAAIVLVFRKDIADLVNVVINILTGKIANDTAERSVVAGIVIGSIPTAFIGLAFSDQFKQLFSSMTAAGIGLLFTGLILMSTIIRRSAGSNTEAREGGHIQFTQALLIGVAQGLAITPGVSRSGTTIAVALLLGVERGLAARFSFLLAIPAILGALALELRDHFQAVAAVPAHTDTTVMLIGAVVAAVTGIFALKFLLRIVRHGKISLFAYYCWALGAIAIVLGIMRG